MCACVYVCVTIMLFLPYDIFSLFVAQPLVPISPAGRCEIYEWRTLFVYAPEAYIEIMVSIGKEEKRDSA